MIFFANIVDLMTFQSTTGQMRNFKMKCCFGQMALGQMTFDQMNQLNSEFILINRKFRVPRKQGAHFLGARAQIQDSWVFSSSV
jgi:hypothetical protein